MSELLEDGIGLAMLNLGAGFPVRHTSGREPLAEFGTAIHAAMHDLFPYQPDNLVCEPGRSLVEESAVLVTTVLDRSHRDGADWLVLDAPLLEGDDRPLATTVPDLGTTGRFNLAGPEDLIACGVSLPENVASAIW